MNAFDVTPEQAPHYFERFVDFYVRHNGADRANVEGIVLSDLRFFASLLGETETKRVEELYNTPACQSWLPAVSFKDVKFTIIPGQFAKHPPCGLT